jgi:hypothetical protein
MIQLSHINKTTKKANKMQTKLDKLNKQLLIDQVNKLKRQSDKLKAECDDKASANNFFESRL